MYHYEVTSAGEPTNSATERSVTINLDDDIWKGRHHVLHPVEVAGPIEWTIEYPRAIAN